MATRTLVMGNRSKKTHHVNIRFCLGVLFGYFIAKALRQVCINRTVHPEIPEITRIGSSNIYKAQPLLPSIWSYFRPRLRGTFSSLDYEVTLPKRKLILIGIMTADKYIDTRARAIHDTWAQAIPGKVLYFVGAGSTYNGDLPVVHLDDVPNNEYPPQKKAFRMLQYMYETYGNEYEWFIRADDDVYIKGDKIAPLLRSINSSEPWYIGQSGEGRRHEQGKLGLLQDLPYCIGGPGVMLSHVALAELGPKLNSCMKSVTTEHEDTEVGRCIQRTVGIGCSSAYELKKLLYQNYREKNGSFTHKLGKEEKMAFTLHPVKRAPYVYRLHNFILGENIQKLNNQVHKLQKEIKMMENYALKLTPSGKTIGLEDDIQNGGVFLQTHSNDSKYVFEYFTEGSYFLHRSIHLRLSPKGRADVSTALAISNSWAKRLAKSFPAKSLSKIDKNGPSYIQVSPLGGVDVRISLQVPYSPKRASHLKHFSIPVKLFQPFTRLEFFEGKDPFHPFSHQDESVEPIRMLIPLSGKNSVLNRFLTTHLPIIVNSAIPVTMVFLLFQDQDAQLSQNIRDIETFQKDFPSCDIIPVNHSTEAFSRAKALTHGANFFGNRSLLLFMDIDMLFTAAFLRRVLQNTIRGKQVYFPVYFSQYNPQFICYQESGCAVRDFQLDSLSGIWRSYGYGMVGVYKSDFLDCGGFDTTIVGWGKEDVDFHERVIDHQLGAFRAADPGLLHLFHEKLCDDSVSKGKWKMCMKSKADLWASTRTLTRMIADITKHDLRDEINSLILNTSSTDRAY